MEPAQKKLKLEVASDSFGVNEAIRLLREIGEQQPATRLFDQSQNIADRDMYLASRSVLNDGVANANADANPNANADANANTLLGDNDSGEAMKIDQADGYEAQVDGGNPDANANTPLGDNDGGEAMDIDPSVENEAQVEAGNAGANSDPDLDNPITLGDHLAADAPDASALVAQILFGEEISESERITIEAFFG